MKILIADDEPLMRNFLFEALKSKNHHILLAQDGEKAIELIQSQKPDLIITDMKMPKKSGLDVLKFALKFDPQTCVIIMTAHGSVENAVEAMRFGAFNYLIKPFSQDAILTLIEKAIKHQKLVQENEFLHQEISSISKTNIIATSSAMKKIMFDIEKIAKSDASVLITGESGTGKEVIAQAIHDQSMRSKNTFIKVNCAAISSTLLESEFFGHEKGSFTGAEKKRAGRFELADQGTLLLDEISEIPICLQPKLLRAIQEKEFERVGGIFPIHVNVRFIATSNRNMKEAIEKNLFREDLYYRLNVMPIHIPPLRERKEDILPLANHFIDKLCKKNHKEIKRISLSAKDKLLNYPWPGNIRELANVMERCIVMDFAKTIEASHLYIDNFCKVPNIKSEPFIGLSLKQVEEKIILATLKAHEFDKTKTAKILGISLKTLNTKINLYQNDQKSS